jgi:kinesin family protein 1/kinesin family protein 3/17
MVCIGKTWSMQGGASDEAQGIIPRMAKHLFDRINAEKAERPTMLFMVTASYFELYNEVIFVSQHEGRPARITRTDIFRDVSHPIQDLLDSSDRRKRSKAGLEIKEHPVLGVYVKGLQEVVIDSSKDMQNLIDRGMNNRTVASTQMNAESSRSHSVFTIKLHQKDSADESKNLFAKVNLVDLAGSERQKSTGAVGATLKEGANINKSLSALGNVINALVEQAKGKKGVFIPYRNSKLTRVLQESLGGNSITIMLAAMSKGLSSADETLSTLKYADRAKAIKVASNLNFHVDQSWILR